MKRRFLIIITCLAYLDGCSQRPGNPQAALVGQYKLHVGSDCSGRGIMESVLELRRDGTSEQRDRFDDGSQFVTVGRWSYDGDDHISIDKLRTNTTLEIDKNASPGFASLIVDWSKPPIILLNPHGDCFFTK